MFILQYQNFLIWTDIHVILYKYSINMLLATVNAFLLKIHDSLQLSSEFLSELLAENNVS